MHGGGGLVVMRRAMRWAADAAGWLQNCLHVRWRCDAFDHGLEGKILQEILYSHSIALQRYRVPVATL